MQKSNISLRPDEVALAWRSAKACHEIINVFTLFQQFQFCSRWIQTKIVTYFVMVIIDRQNYINKSNKLLSQPPYRAIPRDPNNKIKTKLVSIVKRVKSQSGLDHNTYMAMYPMGCGLPKSMVSLRSISWTHHSGLLYPAVDQSPMVWLRNLPKYLNLWLVNLLTTLTAPKTLLNRSEM